MIGDKKSGVNDRAMSTVLSLKEERVALSYWITPGDKTAVKENSGPL